MKKILALIGTIGIAGTSATTVISCNEQADYENSDKVLVIVQYKATEDIIMEKEFYYDSTLLDLKDEDIIKQIQDDQKITNIIKIDFILYKGSGTGGGHTTIIPVPIHIVS